MFTSSVIFDPFHRCKSHSDASSIIRGEILANICDQDAENERRVGIESKTVSAYHLVCMKGILDFEFVLTLRQMYSFFLGRGVYRLDFALEFINLAPEIQHLFTCFLGWE